MFNDPLNFLYLDVSSPLSDFRDFLPDLLEICHGVIDLGLKDSMTPHRM
jgi:hypothetical protein